MSEDVLSSFLPRGSDAWRHPETYDSLLEHDDVAWAGEWLRRNDLFQQALKTLPCRSRKTVSMVKNDVRYTRCAEDCPLAAFGVGCCMADQEHPTLLWLPESNPHVLTVKARVAPRREGGRDLRECSLLKAVLQKKDNALHLLFRDKTQIFQLAVQGITNLDQPVLLQYALQDLKEIRPNLTSFETLYALYQQSSFLGATSLEQKQGREQIRDLQALDGKKAGASHRTIANVIFGGDKALIDQWEDCYRSRMQRVLRTAKAMADGMGYLSLLRKAGKRHKDRNKDLGG